MLSNLVHFLPSEIVQRLHVQTVQVIQYNRHHPLSFAMDELLKMSDGMARDIAELQRRLITSSKQAGREAEEVLKLAK